MNAYSQSILGIVSDSLPICRTMEELELVLDQLTKAVGATYFGYHSYLPLLREFSTLTNVCEEWFDRYQEQNYRQHDPRAMHAHTRSEPFRWDDLVLSETSSKSIQLQILKEGESFGVADGITIPVHGVGNEIAILNLSAPKGMFPEYDVADMALLNLMAHAVHNKFKHIRCDNNAKLLIRSSLTQREQEVMNWTVLGKGSWEIAQILDCAEGTIVFHLRNVAEKLDTSNRAQSVARVIAQAHIKPYANLDELDNKKNTGVAMRFESGDKDTAESKETKEAKVPVK